MSHPRVELKDESPAKQAGGGGHPPGSRSGIGRGDESDSGRRGLWRYWMKRPLASVVLGAAVVLCVREIPSGTSADPPGAPTGRTSSGGVFTPNPWSYLARAGDGSIYAIEPGKETPSDRLVGSATFAYRLRPEREVWSVQLHADLNRGEEGAARKAFADWLGTSPHKYWRNMAERLTLVDDDDSISFVGVRIALSALAVTFGGLLVRSLAWAEPIVTAALEPLSRLSMDPEERERRRRRKVLAAGKCPGCGYEIGGLPKRRCPECNETWGAWELK